MSATNVLEKVAKFAIPVGAAISLAQYSMYDGNGEKKII